VFGIVFEQLAKRHGSVWHGRLSTAAIARGRQWLSEIETSTATIDGIAAQEVAASATSA
jgi:hypothetical protein